MGSPGETAGAPLSNLQLVPGRDNIEDVGLCRHSNKFNTLHTYLLTDVILFQKFRLILLKNITLLIIAANPILPIRFWMSNLLMLFQI